MKIVDLWVKICVGLELSVPEYRYSQEGTGNEDSTFANPQVSDLPSEKERFYALRHIHSREYEDCSGRSSS